MLKSQEKKRARGSSSTTEEDDADTKILEKLTSIQARIENGFSKIDNDIGALKNELKSEIHAIKSELSEATKSLNAAWTEVQDLKQKNEALQEQCDSTLKENNNLKEEISLLKKRVIQQEDYSRRENLRFYNIPENPGESKEECSRKVMDVLGALGATPDDIMFHAIHRTGKPNTTATSNSAANNDASTELREGASRPPRPRPILVRFVSRMDSEWVWENRKELSNSSRFSSVFIDKDLSVESAKERGKLRAAYRKAKELNIAQVHIRGKKLTVNSTSYSVNNLPEYLLPQKNGSVQHVSLS